MRALKMRSALASHWKLTMTNWEQSLKLILLYLHEKLLKNSTLTILWSFIIWSKLERWTSLISECLTSWLKVKKLSVWSVVFSCSMQQQRTILSSDCDVWGKVDIIWQLAMTKHSGWTEKTLQSTFESHTCTKAVMVIDWWSAAWRDQLQLSESQWNHYIWDVGSVNWWDAPKASMPAAGIGQ